MQAAGIVSSEQKQKSHYDSIGTEYAAHYGDEWSQQYRRRFFNDPMTEGISLRDKVVLEAMCGQGETTAFLLEKGARVLGLDISEQELSEFRKRWPQCDALCASILDTGLHQETFDGVFVVGGLHHVHPNIPAAIEEIWRILKPGGYFCFVEPHRNSFPDLVRKFWYRRDRFFVDNEAAIDLDALKQRFCGKFRFLRESFSGGLAYQFVLNSLIWRIPLGLKPYYSPALIRLEHATRFLHSRLMSCFVVAQWQKT